MASDSRKASNTIELPGECPVFKSQNIATSQCDTFILDLDGATVDDMRMICKNYNLKSSGMKKHQLKDAITEFSLDRALWVTAEHSPNHLNRQPHKGPREGVPQSKKTNRKIPLSQIRAKKLQNSLRASNKKRIVGREGRDLQEWVETFVRRIKEGLTADAAGRRHLPVTKVVHRSMSEIRGQNINASNTPIIPSITDPIPESSRQLGTEPPILYEIELAGGTPFFFTDDDFVGFPMARGLASDLDQLLSMWDDESPLWANRSLLIIKSTPIAIKHWQKLYSKFKKGSPTWTYGKSFWLRWKRLVEAYGAGSATDFWNRFTEKDTGKRMTISEVNQILSKEVFDRSRDVCDEASRISEEDFALYFSYMKDGALVRMTNPHGIRKRYEKYQAKKPQWFLKYI